MANLNNYFQREIKKIQIKTKKYFLSSVVITLFFFSPSNYLNAQNIILQKTTSWNGFEKVEFLYDRIPAYYVKPHKPLEGNPWVWQAHFPDWHTTMDRLLLDKF